MCACISTALRKRSGRNSDCVHRCSLTTIMRNLFKQDVPVQSNYWFYARCIGDATSELLIRQLQQFTHSIMGSIFPSTIWNVIATCCLSTAVSGVIWRFLISPLAFLITHCSNCHTCVCTLCHEHRLSTLEPIVYYFLKSKSCSQLVESIHIDLLDVLF